MIDVVLAALLNTAHAAPVSAPIAPGMYRVRKVSGDGSDLTIDSVEPRAIQFLGVPPQKLTVIVKATLNRSDRTIVFSGRENGPNGADCRRDAATSGFYTCVIWWDSWTQWWRQGEWLRFNVVSTDRGTPMGARTIGPNDTNYLVELPISRVETKKPVSPAVVGRALGFETDTNRFGSDYRSLDAPDAQKCQAACAGEAQCKAWTWVKPGVQGPSAKCWLKNAVPVASKSNCCVSGVK
jgi:hypothetical protein